MWINENLFPDLLMWLLVAARAFWAIVQMYETLFRSRTRARANRGFINSLLGQTELCLQVPANIAHAARGRGMRIQLALLDRELNNLENATLTELYPSTATPSMAEKETNAMPFQNSSSSASVASSSFATREVIKESGASTSAAAAVGGGGGYMV